MASERDIERAGIRRGEFIPNFSRDVTSEGINDLHHRMVRLQGQVDRLVAESTDEEDMSRLAGRMDKQEERILALNDRVFEMRKVIYVSLMSLLGAVSVVFLLIISILWRIMA